MIIFGSFSFIVSNLWFLSITLFSHTYVHFMLTIYSQTQAREQYRHRNLRIIPYHAHQQIVRFNACIVSIKFNLAVAM